MAETMQQVNFKQSLKNIPLSSHKEYVMRLTHYFANFGHSLGWGVHHYFSDKEEDVRKETYGFPTQRKPPDEAMKLLKPFLNALAKIAGNIRFRKTSSEFQKNLSRTVSSIDKNPKMLVSADKTSNFYTMDSKDYEKLLKDNITTKYKTSDDETFNEVNKEDRNIAGELGIADRVQVTAKRQTVMFLKDHKPNFRNNPEVRVINPAKQELGKVSKVFLEQIVEIVKKETGLNQWKNTASVLQWFDQLEGKHRKRFIAWDIVDFYPSISEQLLGEALDWASNYVDITYQQRKVIFHVRKTFLFHRDKPWLKTQNSNFDIAMGSFDSAECCDLVGLYLLQQIEDLKLDIDPGKYRDDGLAATELSPDKTDDAKKKIKILYKNNGLKIKISANSYVEDFLDVTLNLRDGSYKPYRKPNSEIVYVHAHSNHPRSVKKNIPVNIEKRLNMLSSSEEIFNEAKGPYQEALIKSGYDYELKYKKVNLQDLNKKKNTRQRYKQMFSVAIAT